MFLPPSFRKDDPGLLHEAIRRTGLATLVTYGPDGLMASHIPLLLDPAPAPLGKLIGHVSRANRQWSGFTPDVPALAIFLGPDAYISPSWYATKRMTGKVVPTWNYVAVHAYGRLSAFEDAERLLALVSGLTEREESSRARPWAVTDAPPKYIEAQLRGIVGLELTIERLEGKWKMSQNRPAEDAAGVVDGLLAEGAKEVAHLVAEENGPS
ncbi:MAG: FMN-binding negative transcriptional regulator [Chloroflexota bacterium]|nr:FMN-binding negative transcriptional regulator [Chloroflexota bacterium]